jgi:hypothetical protein
MITTVTTTTTTTMTTTTTTMLATTTTTTATATAVVVILIMLLIAKELLSAYGEESEGASGMAEEAEGVFVDSYAKAKLLAKTLSAAIYPLLFSFTLIVIVKIMEVL